MSTPDLSCKRFLFPRMHPEGRAWVFAAAGIALLLTWIRLPLGLPGVLLTYGVYLFFRDPERVPPADPRAVVSPADGIVSLITQLPFPIELTEDETPVWRVSVFMSVFNVHVNRMPAAGTVVKTRYVPGAFFNASRDKASTDNERQLYLLRAHSGQLFAVVQIAGLIARRIVRFVNEGQTLERAERFGLIRFGSRVDVYLPPGVTPTVR
ncbi:MAG TPA: phosphatidylserine decarboxylase, partial [Kiritimatiellia bacterium]|nr:phosphatidylserine decarboxylase [Kiritimatiellia bacterium]